MIRTRQQLVDVVVDVQTQALDEPFTYAAADEVPPLGSRVRVPLGKRVVSGWVVANAQDAGDRDDVKVIAEICDDAPIPPGALELARWMRKRYVCTFREALTAVASRRAAQPERLAFQASVSGADRVTSVLQRRYGMKNFTALGAQRALRDAGIAVAHSALRRRLLSLLREGVLTKIPAAMRKRRATSNGRVAQHAAPAASGAGAPLPTNLTPTAQQHDAIERLDAAIRSGNARALLQGVTGSGKTFVYAQLIERVRQRGGRAIVLVPEIALTPQTAGRFAAAFGKSVGVLHSGLSAHKRAKVWQDASDGDLDVVVGARSAVFAPLPNVQLIIIDEEHEPSYKQDVAPRYDAADVATARMRSVGGSVVLGSATPSLESYWDACNANILHVRLRERATTAPLPEVDIVDMTQRRSLHGKRAIGPRLASQIEARLKRAEKTLLFVNRRGYAGLLLCRSCGFAPRCRRCAVSLVVHSVDRSMRCHVCGDAFRIPQSCPKCESADLAPFGVGTQRVEEEIRELFPGARIVRMDADSTGAQGAHERLLTSFAHDGDILIGTQMIAKGLDYPSVTLVGVLAADLDLHRPDFRAAERTFSLLTQVAGRAGRAAPGSQVIVQTYAPEHYAITLAARHDYDGFAAKELELRRELGYPPFGRIAYLVLTGPLQPSVVQSAQELASELREVSRDVEILGPAPDVLPKARGEYRMRVAVKATNETALLETCSIAQRRRRIIDVRTTIIVDPR